MFLILHKYWPKKLKNSKCILSYKAYVFILSAIYDVFASTSTVTQDFSHCTIYESTEVPFLLAETMYHIR